MPELRRSSPDDDDSLTQGEADELVRLLSALLEMDPSGREIEKFIGAAKLQTSDRFTLIERAKASVIERKRRSQFFGRMMFGEPGWDILLALYIAEVSGPNQSVGSVSQLIDKPLSTAIRWIDYLDKARLIARVRHPLDTRVLLLELTDKGRQALDVYFATMPDGIKPA